MSQILILTLLATFALGIFRILAKFVGVNIHPILGAVFIYLGAIISAAVAFLIMRPDVLINSAFKKGAGLALLGGLAIVAFDMLALFVFRKGGDISIFTPLVNGGSILLVALVGFLFLRESINISQFFGILAIIGGIILLTR